MSLRNLECYLCELIQCFEGFVKATLVLLLLGLGTVIVMLYSIIKQLPVSNQQGTTPTVALAQISRSADVGDEEEVEDEMEEDNASEEKTTNYYSKGQDKKYSSTNNNRDYRKIQSRRQSVSLNESLKQNINLDDSNVQNKDLDNDSSKTDNAEKNYVKENSSKTDNEESNENKKSNERKDERDICDSPCAANQVAGSHEDENCNSADAENMPCEHTNPPCEGGALVSCDSKKIKRQPMKICRGGRIGKRSSSSLPRTPLVCTPSNCSLSPKNYMSHLPDCTSRSQLYTCRKLPRKLSCCSDCCQH